MAATKGMAQAVSAVSSGRWAGTAAISGKLACQDIWFGKEKGDFSLKNSSKGKAFYKGARKYKKATRKLIIYLLQLTISQN